MIVAEDNMNVQLENINVTQRDGRVTHLDRVYIRGSHVRLFIVPDMLRSVLQVSNSTSKVISDYSAGTRQCFAREQLEVEV